jgi:YVTN family beta-propeller protein
MKKSCINNPTKPLAITPPLALVSALFLGLTALLPLAAKAQPLDPANIEIQSFPVGLAPMFLAFDGANIWVTNRLDSTVTKLRASDGANLGTFPVGRTPKWITFDGANIWVSNNTVNGTVTKLRASDGAVLGTFFVGGKFPEGIAYDGANIWVVATHGLNSRGAVTKLRASDGMRLGVYLVGQGGSLVDGVLFDGTSIWVATDTLFNTYLVKLDPSDGSLLGRATIDDAYDTYAMTFDGTKVWATNSIDIVTAVRAYNGRVEYTGTVYNPRGIEFDGQHIWVANYYGNSVSVLSARNGESLRTIPVEQNPEGVCFDGTSIWVANSGSNTVSKISPPSP